MTLNIPMRAARGRSRPRVVFVTAALEAVGGIPSYSRSVIAALELEADIEILNLHLTGKRVDQARGFVRTMALLLRRRPDLVVLGHVGFGSIGLIWRLLGGRYVVLAYGIEVWGPRSRELFWTLRGAKLFWPISTFTRTEVLRMAPGSLSGPILGGTIDEDFFQGHVSVEGPFRVLFVASLADLRFKGIDILIEAVERLADEHSIELRVLGSGQASDALSKYVAAHDRNGVVKLVGRVDHEALLAEYRSGDALVLLTKFNRGDEPSGEGLGLVLLEAAASEVPVVGSRRGGSVDTIVEGETGYLLEPGDVDGLEICLRRWIENPSTARAMGEAGRQFVEAEHSRPAFAGRISESLQRALEL